MIGRYQLLVIVDYNGSFATTSMQFPTEQLAEVALEELATKKVDARWPNVIVRRAYVPSKEQFPGG